MVSGRRLGDRFPQIDEVFDGVAKNLNRLIESEQKDEITERNTNRVKTRFLGFKSAAPPENDEHLYDYMETGEHPEAQAPFGQLVIVQGPGCGRSFSMIDGINRIGRGEGQEIQLEFGDNYVSRKSHATIFHYGEGHGFEIRDGGKANPVLLNGRALRGNEHLESGDEIRIGETTMRFLAI